MQPEHQRQGRGDQKHVIKIIPEERTSERNGEHPPIDAVASARDDADGIAGVAVTFHSRPAISRPVTKASTTLNVNLEDSESGTLNMAEN